jgi:ComF family protein
MRCQPREPYQVYSWAKNRQSCLLCEHRGEHALPVCTECEAELPWLGAHCRICALPLPDHGLTCGACLKREPAFSRVEAPFRYAFPVDSLITAFKHRARWPYGRLLGELLARHLQHAFDEGLPRPQLLLPVPLAKKRLRQRGFNQAGMLGHWLAAQLDIPCTTDGLLRQRETPAQQGLDAAARKRNLRDAFAIGPNLQPAGQYLALVDDVLTTGATAEAIARLLRRAGAARVDIYCLARTPAPGD